MVIKVIYLFLLYINMHIYIYLKCRSSIYLYVMTKLILITNYGSDRKLILTVVATHIELI